MTERTTPPYAADERTMLVAFLDYHRDTLRLKTEGMDAEQLDTRLGPSTLTLGGLLKHMAFVEDRWFGVNLEGREHQPPFDAVDWRADPDWDLDSARGASPEELRSLFDRFTDLTDEILERHPDLDRPAARVNPKRGTAVTLRWILVHMIEEYARHNGHADLIRESIDGSTGM